MKRPLNLPHPAENRIRLVEAAGCQPSQSEQRVKREKKHQSFTLCEVCNIQLNSAAQAQIHYNGKSHQKRLKQLHKGKVPTGQGEWSASGLQVVLLVHRGAGEGLTPLSGPSRYQCKALLQGWVHGPGSRLPV
uniref:U1-type domain-containing protein n=1 Tax=Pelusios castaneus TaxID=367368 RepID=A0A8C8RJX3_9SAUR